MLTGQQLLDFLSLLQPSELQKEVRIGLSLMDDKPVLEIDDCSPYNIYLNIYVGPASEN